MQLLRHQPSLMPAWMARQEVSTGCSDARLTARLGRLRVGVGVGVG